MQYSSPQKRTSVQRISGGSEKGNSNGKKTQKYSSVERKEPEEMKTLGFFILVTRLIQYRLSGMVEVLTFSHLSVSQNKNKKVINQ